MPSSASTASTGNWANLRKNRVKRTGISTRKSLGCNRIDRNADQIAQYKAENSDRGIAVCEVHGPENTNIFFPLKQQLRYDYLLKISFCNATLQIETALSTTPEKSRQLPIRPVGPK